MGPYRKFTVRRMMVAVAASCLVWALLAAFDVPPDPGFAYGMAGCLAILGITFLSRDTRDLASAFAAVVSGILVGAPLVGDACTPAGIFAGPIVGCCARVMTRRGQVENESATPVMGCNARSRSDGLSDLAVRQDFDV